ncbi:hypothetical protein CesoFtcFv8_009104 [Champsocephalus esox]|uniref:Uncharacterized protein n=1 Tax=Champsocephalus esox TaxID=159716 RepID=A0AAN8C9W7_9TELE|nr:hypothetical protein CesoFtcFv8_009104 [Champsocephalus esox]
MGLQITPRELAPSKSYTEVPRTSQTNTKYNPINPPTITQPLVVDTPPPTAELVSQIHPLPTMENVVSQDTNLSPVLTLTIKNPLIRTNIMGKQLWRTKPSDPTPSPGPSTEVTCEESHLSPSPPTPPMECFRRHEHRGNKKSNWSLTPKREVIIMGASNISRLPLIHNLKIQVDSFPGANMAQATHLIKRKTPTSPETKIVILCFGLNDRNTVTPETLNHDLQDLLSAAHNTFPNAKIHVPLINASMRLPFKAYRNITLLNAAIKRIPGYLEKMDTRDYITADDNIHWTPKTANLMWKNWRSSLDL